MFKKRFIIIFYKKILLKTFIKCFYRLTLEARFDWRYFLNIDEITEEMKVMLEMFFHFHFSSLNVR